MKTNIAVGVRFGRLVVVSRAQGRYRWLCLCDCSTETTVYQYSLTSGHTQSCGCKRHDSKPILQDEIAGFRSGALVALAPTGERNAKGTPLWRCRCDCGNFTVTTSTSFSNGKIRSCGCRQFQGNRLADGAAAFNRLYERYRRHAIKANREFALTKAEFHFITQKHCIYCGAYPALQEHFYSRTYNTGKFFGNGIDRVNNAEGYTTTNSAPCCETCNRAKRALPLESFKTWIHRLTDHVVDAEWEKVAFSGGC